MKETKQIRLRAFMEKDMMVLHEWINDPEVIQYTNNFRPISEMEQREWFYSLSKIKNQYLFAIELKEKKQIIGTCGIYDFDSINRKAELRIKIGKKTIWNKGYGSQALNILIDFGLNDLNLHRIWLRVLSDNIRAINLYKKEGFNIEGILKNDIYIRGKYKDLTIMGLIKKQSA